MMIKWALSWVAALVVLTALLLALGGCDPKGQPCRHAGDVRAERGRVYTCTQTRGGLVWAGAVVVPGRGVHTLPAPGPAGGVQ